MSKKYFKHLILLVGIVSFISAEINVYTHRHYDSDKILFKKFTDMYGIEVNVIKGSADQLIQRLQSEGKKSPADILLTVDAGRLVRAKDMGLLEPVSSKILTKNVPEKSIMVGNPAKNISTNTDSSFKPYGVRDIDDN